jgi:alpha-galactosidase/6-phospho-beta-glucosidase family protein
MSAKSNLKKNCFPDSNHIFFHQKLSLEGKNVLPQILEAHNNHSQPHHHEPNFLTVFKKPIISVYDRISHSQNTTVTNQVLNLTGKKEGRAVCVVGQPKEFEKRGSITHQKQRKVMADMDAYEQIRKYEESEEVVLLQNNLPDGLKKSPTKKSDKKVFATDQKEPSDYYYCIGQGNNSELV